MESFTTPVRPWADLSPDLLLDISNRLDDGADFTRFHAVCTPWRNSPATIRPAFPPWLFTLRDGHIMHSTVDIGRGGSGHGDVVLAESPAAQCARGDINCLALRRQT
jgi:hypothetical protein